MLVLVTGATGYVASQLVPVLVQTRLLVRVLARDPRKLDGRAWAKSVEISRGDVMDPDSLVVAMQGVHTAYYLVHCMTDGPGYTDRELVGARNFAQSALRAGVQHIVYLGGLADPAQKDIGAHMQSRIQTGAVLREGSVPVTEFRASVIVGSGSTSFEIIRSITEMMPIVPAPSWVAHKAQPIAVRNVVEYLVAALERRGGDGRSKIVEIAGPEVLTYGELMLRYAGVRQLNRRLLPVSRIPTWLTSLGIALTTPVPRSVASALVASLSADSVATDPLTMTARSLYPHIKPIDFDTAVKEALLHLHPGSLERVWDSDGGAYVKRATQEGFFIEQHETSVAASPDRVFQVLGSNDYLQSYAWMWRLSGWAERLLASNRPALITATGAASPQFSVDTVEPNRLLVRSPIFSVAGDTWIEWRVEDRGHTTSVKQTLYFAPRGLTGFVYWFVTRLLRTLLFGSLLRVVTARAVKLMMV